MTAVTVATDSLCADALLPPWLSGQVSLTLRHVFIQDLTFFYDLLRPPLPQERCIYCSICGPTSWSSITPFSPNGLCEMFILSSQVCLFTIELILGHSLIFFQFLDTLLLPTSNLANSRNPHLEKPHAMVQSPSFGTPTLSNLIGDCCYRRNLCIALFNGDLLLPT